jgi:hypothetical protein
LTGLWFFNLEIVFAAGPAFGALARRRHLDAEGGDPNEVEPAPAATDGDDPDDGRSDGGPPRSLAQQLASRATPASPRWTACDETGDGRAGQGDPALSGAAAPPSSPARPVVPSGCSSSSAPEHAAPGLLARPAALEPWATLASLTVARCDQLQDGHPPEPWNS